MEVIHWLFLALLVLCCFLWLTVYSLAQCVSSLQRLVLLNDEKLSELERRLYYGD